MKSLKTILTESKDKYCINWIDKQGHNMRYTCNNYRAFIDSLKGEYKYYDVMSMNSSNFSEPDGLIEWSGEDGYWANVYLASTEPDKAEKWFTPFKGNNLKKIERCKK